MNFSKWRRRLKAGIARRLPPFTMIETRTEILRRLGVEIGEGSLVLGEFNVVPQGVMSLIHIGRDCSVNGPVYLDVHDSEQGAKVSIGDGVCISHYVSIYTHSHRIGPSAKRCDDAVTCEPVTIGDGTWIASHVIILPGSRIGKGCVVGAGSIVNRSAPCKDDVFLSGNPARVVGPVTALIGMNSWLGSPGDSP